MLQTLLHECKQIVSECVPPEATATVQKDWSWALILPHTTLIYLT